MLKSNILIFLELATKVDEYYPFNNTLNSNEKLNGYNI